MHLNGNRTFAAKSKSQFVKTILFHKEMNRTRRRKGSYGGEGDTPPIDRLSDLPDSILSHILSFLLTEDAVKTSVLARIWRFVWKYVPNLDFFRQNHDIITRVLLLHKLPTVNTLSIYLDDGDNRCSDYLLESWIIDAFARNVRNLYLSNFYHKKLPSHLTCETLVDLNLDCIIPTANTVRLPCLKELELSHVLFETDESLPRLLSGCPVLEYLVLKLVITNHELVDFYNISSLSVKRLEVILHYRQDHVYLHKYRLKIDTPALVNLQLHDRVTEHIESGIMKSLTEASIDLWNLEEKEDDYVYSQSVLEFVNRLCYVTRLKLDLELLTEIIDSVVPVSFHNLTELELNADGLFLSKFLKNADNLEILKFYEVGDGDHRAWVEPEQVPTCLSSHLRTVKMLYVCRMSDFEIIRYALRNARILERMEISCCGDFEEKKWLIKEISKMERGSEACELAFV